MRIGLSPDTDLFRAGADEADHAAQAAVRPFNPLWTKTLEPSLLDIYSSATVHTDLLAQTIRSRKILSPVIKVLQNHKILYKCSFPTKLLISCNFKQEKVSSIDTGWKLFKAWKLILQESAVPSPIHPQRFDMEWSPATRPEKPI